MAGSCDWLLTVMEFMKWLDEPSKQKNSLEIIGGPGSGKSYMAAFLVQHFSESSSPVLYFFCNANDCEKRSTISVLRTLLAQYLRLDASLAEHVLPAFRQNGRTTADSSQMVAELFRIAMTHHQNRRTYIVVDAVDECIDAWDHDGLLAQLQSCTQNTTTKFVITRRDLREYEYSLCSSPWSASYELTMMAALTTPHIHKYIQCRVQKMTLIADTDVAPRIIGRISEDAAGLWLYARLMVDNVERAPSEERAKRCLDVLPSGLFELYAQILRSCEVRMTDDQQDFAKYLYIWLDASDYVPGFLSYSFQRLPYHMLQLVFCFVNGGTEVFDAATLARELGAPLIEVHEIDSTYEIQFTHRSAYQYLAQC